MKSKQLFLPFLLVLIFITSCSETKVDGPFTNWKERNLAFIDSVEQVYNAQNIPEELQNVVVSGSEIGRFKVEAVSTLNEPIYVYYKVIDRSDRFTEKPLFNDRVDVYYRGMLIDEGVIGTLSEPRYITRAYADLRVFDSSFDNDDPDFAVEKPVQFGVNGLVAGFTEILQWMSPGDRWEVYIPAIAAYGKSGSGAIPGHSVLVFDITLDKIHKLKSLK